MTRDEIIKLAREAGWGNVVSMPHIQALERFAALVADAEREACAQVCIQHAGKHPYPSHAGAAATACAAAIRGRSNK